MFLLLSQSSETNFMLPEPALPPSSLIIGSIAAPVMSVERGEFNALKRKVSKVSLTIKKMRKQNERLRRELNKINRNLMLKNLNEQKDIWENIIHQQTGELEALSKAHEKLTQVNKEIRQLKSK